MKTETSTLQTNEFDNQNSIEATLRTYLQPVVPRNEFVDRLRGKLEQQVLPVQKKRVVSFYRLLEVTLQTVALMVITILTVRLFLLLLTVWKILRASNAR